MRLCEDDLSQRQGHGYLRHHLQARPLKFFYQGPILYLGLYRTLYRDFLSKRNPAQENDQVASLLDASVETLKCHNAKELLNTFMQSERVFNDLEIALGKVCSPRCFCSLIH